MIGLWRGISNTQLGGHEECLHNTKTCWNLVSPNGGLLSVVLLGSLRFGLTNLSIPNEWHPSRLSSSDALIV